MRRNGQFAAAAEEFCAWCVGGTLDGASGARAAIRHLAHLYSMALDLQAPTNVDLDLDGEAVSDETWKTVFERCAALPFSYYSVAFNPHAVPPEEPVVGDLGDDLADIYRDLISGLSLHRNGHTKEAELDWHRSFESHWGRHASSAIQALHCWFEENGW
ncbi:MAG: DUF5063 domain-containing protein [Planctomycetota bacterium]|nr:DUF5063 domain-containing protein [Planctomycetota bacterium]